MELFFSTVEIFLSSFWFRLCRRYVAVYCWTMKICMVIISVLVYCIICEISKQIKMELISSSVQTCFQFFAIFIFLLKYLRIAIYALSYHFWWQRIFIFVFIEIETWNQISKNKNDNLITNFETRSGNQSHSNLPRKPISSQ